MRIYKKKKKNLPELPTRIIKDNYKYYVPLPTLLAFLKYVLSPGLTISLSSRVRRGLKFFNRKHKLGGCWQMRGSVLNRQYGEPKVSKLLQLFVNTV